MGIVISLILIAFGAILAWAVNTDGGSVDPQVVGVILMIVGLVVFLISLVLWRTWWGAGFWGPGTTIRRLPRSGGGFTDRPGGEALPTWRKKSRLRHHRLLRRRDSSERG
jgi:hypothetical protein